MSATHRHSASVTPERGSSCTLTVAVALNP